MANYLTENPDLRLKLSSTSHTFKTIFAKLLSRHLEVIDEERKNREYYNSYMNAYADANDDLELAESLSKVSFEVDVMLNKLENYDDKY